MTDANENETTTNISTNPTEFNVAENTEGVAREGRDEQGRWLKGVSGNPEGSEKWTEEQKLKRKAQKELIEEYKQGLIEALQGIKPVLITKALEGDMTAIKEINDRAMGKAPQSVDMTTNGKDIPQPIIKLDVCTDNSDQQNNSTQQED